MKWTTKARQKALDLLEEQEVLTAPIDVGRIAHRLGVIVIEEDLQNEVSGMLSREGPRPVILVNESDSSARKRFSIAHELGHFRLHKDQVFVDRPVRFRDGRSSLGQDREEIEANHFASELLMPSPLIWESIAKIEDESSPLEEDELVTQLSKQFDVSKQAMEYRLADLGVLRTV
jgi:Zn-dependent peptidase ImmA (M78 family)